ncbi:MAG TPA: hypothetical protein VKF81_01480 [Blastocatellia bacterium]|nr:hypothetical protein [Blastocatellia bacterium]
MRTLQTSLCVVFVAIALSFPRHVAQTSDASSDELKPGQVIERVVCKNSPEQTYALYLPSNYSANRRWPLVAAFDPGARGKAPVERFKEAAERYGYIVCGSNNSRNGPLAVSGDAAKAMLGDISSRFAIDEKRVYLTGFSGGARAATAIAVWLKGQVAGVIGCGAGLAQGIEPTPALPFVFYGTVGTEDFNYSEMKQLDRALDSARVTHRIEVFAGGHSWAPVDVCVRAIEWMELQAIKSGLRPRDDSFIDRLFIAARESATAKESASQLYDAYTGYSQVASDFKGVRDVAEFEKKAAQLKDSRAVKQAINKERDQENEELQRMKELFGLRAKLRTQATAAALGEGGAYGGVNSQPEAANDPQTRQTFLSDLKHMLSDLKRKSDAKEASTERAFARRVLNQFTITLFEQSSSLIQRKRYELAASNLAIDAEIMPDNWRVLYNLACAHALAGDKRRAIETLNRAVQKGFGNVSELENNRQLDAIREEAGFKKVIEGLKEKK